MVTAAAEMLTPLPALPQARPSATPTFAAGLLPPRPPALSLPGPMSPLLCFPDKAERTRALYLSFVPILLRAPQHYRWHDCILFALRPLITCHNKRIERFRPGSSGSLSADLGPGAYWKEDLDEAVRMRAATGSCSSFRSVVPRLERRMDPIKHLGLTYHPEWDEKVCFFGRLRPIFCPSSAPPLAPGGGGVSDTRTVLNLLLSGDTHAPSSPWPNSATRPTPAPSRHGTKR